MALRGRNHRCYGGAAAACCDRNPKDPMKRLRDVTWLLASILVASLPACANRSASRDYGHADAFRDTNAGYTALHPAAAALQLTVPVDERNRYYDTPVAGTSWVGCRTDTYEDIQTPVVPQLLSSQLRRDVEAAKLFTRVTDASTAAEYSLATEIRAFCSQAKGYGFIRVAGVIALKFTLRHGDQVLLDKEYGSVITDADKEYTGSTVGWLEQAMRVLLSDTLRHVHRDLLKDVDAALAHS